MVPTSLSTTQTETKAGTYDRNRDLMFFLVVLAAALLQILLYLCKYFQPDKNVAFSPYLDLFLLADRRI